MIEAIDTYLSNFKSEQERYASALGGINHDVYEKRLKLREWPKFDLTPHSMYFYYVRINSDGRLLIDHYFYVDGDEADTETWKEIPYDKEGLQALVKKLAINARPPRRGETRNPLPRQHGDFRKTRWVHKAYIAIFFDEAHWSLRKQGSSSSAVTFVIDEGGQKRTPNHSFFDAIDLPITMPINNGAGPPREDTRSAIVFINHMKGDESGRDVGRDQNGNDLPEERQEFKFSIILDVKSTVPDDPPTVFIIDPGGENGGPSVPPPPVNP